jgi:SlyX protein
MSNRFQKMTGRNASDRQGDGQLAACKARPNNRALWRTTNMSQTDERLARLEEHAAHQARTIDELSVEIARQWKIIDAMQVKLDRLTERFLALEEASVEAHPVNRPPHF